VTGAQYEGEAISVSTNAGSFAARLAIAADGRHSPLREAAGISCNAWTYDQMALATSFAHSGPHDGMSTEYHKYAGPFTTVPLPGNRSSLVWMERPERANELMAMSDRDLAIEIQLASHGELGKISEIGPRRLFPMQGVVAREFGRQRTLLIGEAAHVVPPIGAQGLNMSLRDAAQAAELIVGAADPGAHAIIDQYDRLRRRDVAPRQQVIDFMNRSLLSRSTALESARAIGLDMISLLPPLRRVVMRQGLSPSMSLPRVMQDQGISPDFIA
jgi:2-octaprenyl-6-methoxyphenol hydroxylase